MIEFFQKKYALSEEGAKNLRFAIFTQTLFELAINLPIILAIVFVVDKASKMLGMADMQLNYIFYISYSLIAIVLMLLASIVTYKACYEKIYTESAKSRLKLAEVLRKLPLSFFGQKNVSDLSATIMTDVTEIETLFSHAAPQLYASIISIFLVVTGLFVFDWRLALAIFWVVPFAALVFYFAQKNFEKKSKDTYNIKRKVTDKIQEGLDSAQEIKSYNGESAYLNELNKDLDKLEKDLLLGELPSGVIMNVAITFLKLGFATILILGAKLVMGEELNLLVYLAFLLFAGTLYDPFVAVMFHFSALLHLKPRIERMREMDEMPRQEGREDFKPKNFDIVFDGVDFSYHKGLATLKNISFEAKQGEVTALIGASGSGKSTIARLAARFWDIEKGKIFLGGEDISQIEPEVLLRHFSIVFQEVMLFNTSLMENIRLGKKDASDEEVKEAARLAQCEDFIERLPQGYDTLIGENGEKLSGGERQRISIARAILKNAEVILLDEATASLDAENESKIQMALSELVKNKTVLIIAHRMRTVAGADKIVALEEGKIAEVGTPSELKAKEGIFAKMLKLQTQE